MKFYVMDTEADGLLDTISKFHCFVFKEYKKDRWFIFIDEELPEYFKEELKELGEVVYLTLGALGAFVKRNLQNNGLVCHNILGFDLRAMKKLKYIKNYTVGKDTINNLNVRIFDSLVMSRSLNPDRQLPFGCPSKKWNPVEEYWQTVGAHGLDAWGYRVANEKPKVDDWRNLPLKDYVHRCIEDVKINEATFTALVEEAKQKATDTKVRKGDWQTPLLLATKDYYLMVKQEETGCPFDVEGAEALIDRIDTMMQEIEEEVEPQLPLRDIPKSKRPKFPAEAFKKDESFSAHGLNWLERLGYDINRACESLDKLPPKNSFKKDQSLSKKGEEYCLENGIDTNDLDACRKFINEMNEIVNTPYLNPEDEDQARQDLRDKKEPIMKEPMRISNQKDIKEYLVFEGGWIPLHWRTKDITRDDNKRPYNDEEIKMRSRAYIEELKENPFKTFIYKEYNFNFEKKSFEDCMEFVKKKARYLITSPTLKDDRGNLCENLERVNGDMAKEIVKWLSLRNRRSVIKALDENKETGWLNNPRLSVDGRLSGAHTGLTNTHRKKHTIIANLPKADESVLLGKEMRSLFYAPEGYLMVGYDAQALENRVAAMYAWAIDKGEYAELILEGDCHTTYAEAYSKAAGFEITRSDGKSITYGVLYGAQANKVAKMLGVDSKRAQKIIDAFWDTNWSLKKLKEALESYWEATGKKYIMGLDGRKIYTRSKHALLNCLFQSAGAIIMDTAGAYMHNWLEKRGYFEDDKVQRVIYYHDEYQYLVRKDLIKKWEFSTKEEAEAFTYGDKILSNVHESYEKEGVWTRYYSPIGELGVRSIRKAGELYNSPLLMDAAYDVGRNWAETH